MKVEMRGLFITFEGGEGSGKTTQIQILKDWFKKNTHVSDLCLTREPGGTNSAELIRNLILKDYFNRSQKDKFDKYTDTLLYLAARNEHVKMKIIPSTNTRYTNILSLRVLL